VKDCSPTLGSGNGSDTDADGIKDECEQKLAETYAPVIYHSSSEPNLPSNVDSFLRVTSLWFYNKNCNPVLTTRLIARPTQEDLVSQQQKGDCGLADTSVSNGTRSEGKQRTFFLEDVAPEFRSGSPDSKDWITYYHAYQNYLGGVTIQYWRFYAFNTGKVVGGVEVGFHGGDWEGIHIILDQTLQPVKVGLLGHTSIDYLPWSRIDKDQIHPKIYSEVGGHASRVSGEGIDFNNPSTFIRQESWTNGQVRWPNRPLSQSGGLLNLGEKLAPMNRQAFIQYSGLWGSPSRFPDLPTFFFSSGYWGPAFNETGMRSDGFITAWCDGIRVPTQQECFPTARSR
jgi:hypothetical protein